MPFGLHISRIPVMAPATPRQAWELLQAAQGALASSLTGERLGRALLEVAALDLLRGDADVARFCSATFGKARTGGVGSMERRVQCKTL